MAGKTTSMHEAWTALGKGLYLVKPKGDGDGVHNFLGCEHSSSTRGINGKTVKMMEWNASHSLERCIRKYEEAVHKRVYTHESRAVVRPKHH